MELEGDFQPNVFDEDSSWSAVMKGIEPIDYNDLQAAQPSNQILITAPKSSHRNSATEEPR